MALTAALVAAVLALTAARVARRARSPRARRGALVVLGVAGAATAYLLVAAAVLRTPSRAQYTALDGADPGRLTVPDATLGFVHRPGARVRAVRSDDAGVIYDVVYTIGDDGLRVTPGDPAGTPIVFFGCSYTFGEGVGDDAPLPVRVSALLGGRASVANRGIAGSGPHQMLRALETGRAPIPAGARVFYLALGDHVRRVAGKTPWDDAGPRYALDGDGVRFVGPLHAPLVRPLRRAAASLVRNGILPTRVFGYDVTDDERELFVRIVARSADEVRAAGGRFTVVFWDDTPQDADLAGRLAARGLEVWRVSELLPGVDRGPLMIPRDTHPAPDLHRMLAAAITARAGLVTSLGGLPDGSAATGSGPRSRR